MVRLSKESNITEYKACLDCKQIKPLDDYNSCSRRLDGKMGYCKPCFKIRNDASRKKNPDSKKKATDKWRANNKEKVAATKRAWKVANRDLINAQKREWNKKNKELVREMNQRSYVKNPSQFIINAQRRYAKKKGVEQKVIRKSDYLKMYRKGCFYCGSFDRIEIDHVQPIEKNGRNAIGNLVGACLPCNRSKSDLFVMEWRIREMKKLGR